MKPKLVIPGLCLVFIITSMQVSAAVGPKLATGETEVIYDFDEGSASEGIAFDRNGNMFLGVRTIGVAGHTASDIIKITPWGETSVLANLGPTPPGANGLVGLTTDPKGNVYVAFSSRNEKHGVWKICPDGEMQLLPGSEQIILPNSVTLDKKGNIYVTDSDPLNMGTTGIWRLPKKGEAFEPWCGDEPVLAAYDNPLGFPLVGANGIAFGPPNNIYVANTEKGLIAHITILEDGSAGTATVLATHPMLLINPDGLALDTNGDIYTVLPPSTFPLGVVPPMSPVVKIHADTGEVEPLMDPFTFPDGEYFDFPTSIVFGTGPMDKKSVYVANLSGMEGYGMPPGSGAKITQVGVGVPGFTGQ